MTPEKWKQFERYLNDARITEYCDFFLRTRNRSPATVRTPSGLCKRTPRSDRMPLLLGLLVALCWCAERLTSYVNRKFGWWPSMFVGVALALVIVALFATIADRQLHRRSTELDDLQQGEMELILWSTEHYLTSDSTAITP